MNGQDRAVVRLFEQSALARVAMTAGERLAAAAADSRLLASARDRWRRATRLDLPLRIRCAGVLILTATVTHELLLLIAPRQAAPAALHAPIALVAVSAAAVAWAAPRLASAWVALAADEPRIRKNEDAHG
jgi:hypothetical protein